MIALTNASEMDAFLQKSTDIQLNALLIQRRAQLDISPGFDLGELAHFFIVEADDRLDPDPCLNLVDGLRFGHPDFMPSWEWIERHGAWWELAFVLTDDGFGHVVLVPDSEGIDPDLRALCRAFA